MSFEQCALYCAGNTELVKEFNRLSGCHLGEHRTPIDIAIDSACGYDPDREAMPQFFAYAAPKVQLDRG